MQISNHPLKEVIILGMHRSGTSVVANLASSLGIDMGTNLLAAQTSNVDGHFEDIELIRINDKILKDLGDYKWDTPPPQDKVRNHSDNIKNAYTEYITNRKKSNSQWGAKDPRLCITIEQFHELLENPRYIICRRERDSVANSLSKRDMLPNDKASDLYEYYNSCIDIFASKKNRKCLFIQYEDLQNNPTESIKRITSFLEKDIPINQLEDLADKVRSKKSLKAKKHEIAQLKLKQHKKKGLKRPWQLFRYRYWKKLLALSKEEKYLGL